MNHMILHSFAPILLVGGGQCCEIGLIDAVSEFETVVAADGGAGALLRIGRCPDAVIGDMDSLSDADRAALPPDVLHPISEQDSTDFDKALRNIQAPLVVAHGFLGGRVDHQLAALTVLARYPERRCILVGAEDIVLLCPPRLSLDLPMGSRFSLYPLAGVTGRSQGLRWPIDDLLLSPAGRVGTSNEVSGPVQLEIAEPALLVLLPVESLPHVMDQLAKTPQTWPARAR